MTKTLESGIHIAMDRDEYDRINAVNQSTLKLFQRSAAHAREMMVNPPEPSSAMNLGQAVHAAVLDPDAFAEDYVAAPKLDRRTKKGRELWERFNSRYKDSIVLTGDEHAKCLSMSRAVWANETAAEVLRSDGQNEMTVLWKDKHTKLDCKARIDRFTKLADWPVLLDLKTTWNASPDQFGREIAKYQYHVQAAFYVKGMKALHDVPRRFLFIAVEKDPPYATCVYELDSLSMEEGNRKANEYLLRYAHCVKHDEWPGYPDGIMEAQLPSWALSSVMGGTLDD